MQQFLAVSNLSWQGLPISRIHPPEERSFATLEEATAWLREIKCGGAVSTHDGRDFKIVASVPAGG